MIKKACFIISLFLVCSCVSKKEILYLQDADDYNGSTIDYEQIKIQANDILNITVGALIPETAIPYNKPLSNSSGGQVNSIELMKLNGYLVSPDKTINFPVLGEISVANKTTTELQEYLTKELRTGGHLSDPNVSVNIINAKVTILGEVNSPGTYTFDEERISVLQALGFAGDITINGVREDVLIMREVDGIRQITHIDLTASDWLKGPYYFVKPNDVIVVNQNATKVKSAGFIGNLGALIGLASFAISITILLTR